MGRGGVGAGGVPFSSMSATGRVRAQENAEMEEQLAAFLAAGGEIKVIPLGESALDTMGRSKNIVLARKKAHTRKTENL